MSKAQLHAPPGRGPRSKGGSSSGGADVDRPLESMPGFGNSFLARALVLEGAGQAGGPGLDGFGKAMMQQEDPEKFHFAEDGGTQGPGPAKPRKTQQDALPALRDKHAGTEFKDVEKGKAFVKGEGDKAAVDPNDVAQGALGDCYLMAGMAAVARADPAAIQKLIKDNGDGTFQVTLYVRKSSFGRPEPVTRTIDARLAMKSPSSPLYAGFGDASGTETELWAALLEKALAQHKKSYDRISGGNIGKDGFNFNGASELFTGKYEGYQRTANMTGDQVLRTISQALAQKKPVTVDSNDMEKDEAMAKDAQKWNVYGNHAYAPEKVDIAAGTIDLQNPWGSHHVKGLPVADFKRFYRSIRVGGG